MGALPQTPTRLCPCTLLRRWGLPFPIPPEIWTPSHKKSQLRPRRRDNINVQQSSRMMFVSTVDYGVQTYLVAVDNFAVNI